MVALLVSIIDTLEIVFGQNKKLLDGKGPFSDNVAKIRLDIHAHIPYSRTDLMIKLFQ